MQPVKTPRFRLRAIEPGSRRRQRGSYFVELSLVLLPLMAMLLAVVDFAMPVFLRSTFSNAAREGVRYGITYRTRSGLSQSASIKQVVQENAAGFLAGTTGLSYINVKYYSPTTFAEVTGAGANDGGNIVEVSIRNYTWGWIAPLWRSSSPLTINVTSSDRLEQLPQGSSLPTP